MAWRDASSRVVIERTSGIITARILRLRGVGRWLRGVSRGATAITFGWRLLRATAVATARAFVTLTLDLS